ncbi:MAG: hypothetical protein AB1778_09100, partial [Candidatus Bipolaricaulota bacterium]
MDKAGGRPQTMRCAVRAAERGQEIYTHGGPRRARPKDTRKGVRVRNMISGVLGVLVVVGLALGAASAPIQIG